MSNYIVDGADLTSVANAIRTKGGTSAQMQFPQGFITAVEAIPTSGGGSGATVIASGTFAGTGVQYVTIPLGKKMAQRNFILKIWVDQDTEYAYDTNYKFAAIAYVVDGDYAYFDLSANVSNKTATGVLRVKVNNSGTISNVTPRSVIGSGITIRNAALGSNYAIQQDKLTITRSATGFTLSYNQGSSAYKFQSGLTYKWAVLYYGTDPQNDIVEVT